MTPRDDNYVMVGGMGGSGTRVVSVLLQDLGFYIGPALNDAQDCLLFTLLFKRPDWFDTFPPDADIIRAAKVFIQAMRHGPGHQTGAIRKLVHTLQASGHKITRTKTPIRKMLATPAPDLDTARGIAWKEPTTHVFLPQLAQHFPRQRYVHVLRNGLDMALSRNRHQLRNWGPHFGVIKSRDIPVERTQLELWDVINSRAIAYGRDHMQGRFLLLNYDRLCSDFEAEAAGFLTFLGCEDALARLPDLATRLAPRSRGRFAAAPAGLFTPDDIARVAAYGFDTSGVAG